MLKSVYRPDHVRIEEMYDWHRSSGELVCDICGCRYWEHQPVIGYTWLRKLCDGTLVKL